jgi:hypothetical protein
MPIHYDIDERRRLVLVTGTGVVTHDDVLEHLADLNEDGRYQAPMRKLIDYRDVSDIQISTDASVVIAATKKKLSERFAGEKCAFVASKDAVFGTARVHEARVEGAGISTSVFRDFDEAMAWLELPPNPA